MWLATTAVGLASLAVASVVFFTRLHATCTAPVGNRNFEKATMTCSATMTLRDGTLSFVLVSEQARDGSDDLTRSSAEQWAGRAGATPARPSAIPGSGSRGSP